MEKSPLNPEGDATFEEEQRPTRMARLGEKVTSATTYVSPSESIAEIKAPDATKGGGGSTRDSSNATIP
jgi:hypothetical protein